MKQQEKPKKLDKYTQFTPHNQNNIEPDLELDQFPSFINIELISPSSTQLLLKRDESKGLNIIYDNNNNPYEDKNIKEILSTNYKNSSRLDDIYKIELPDCFMSSSVVKFNKDNKNKKNNENIKKDMKDEIQIKKKPNAEEDFENEKENENINNDIHIEFPHNQKDEIKKENKEIDEKRKNVIDNEKDIDNDNATEGEEEGEIIKEETKEMKENLNYYIIDIEEDELGEGEIAINQNIEKENTNKFQKNNDNITEEKYESNWNNREIIDINEPIKQKKKSLTEKEDEVTNINKKKLRNLNDKFNITTLNIIGEKNDHYYLGKIIEKSPNYPSTLGIIRYINLEQFSENFYNEKLKFEEIAMKDNDFEKIIKLIPIGNKKYIFSDENSSKIEIFKEENDLIILHGKVAQETFYYIMKLTGQINRSSEYTIYKVKNNKKLIKRFKESIGLIEEEQRRDENIISEGINYGIEEDPNTEYYIMPCQQFLSKYRKLKKIEKEIEIKKKQIDDKRAYNENFESIFSEINSKYKNIVNNSKKEIELKSQNIEKLKNEKKNIFQEEQSYFDIYDKAVKEKKIQEKLEEQLKIKILQNKKKIIEIKKYNRQLDQINIKKEDEYKIMGFVEDLKFLYNPEEIINKQKKLIEKEKMINNFSKNIYCSKCNIKKRDVIFCECSHLMLCNDCLCSISEKGNKIKASCPSCKRLCKRFFNIVYE